MSARIKDIFSSKSNIDFFPQRNPELIDKIGKFIESIEKEQGRMTVNSRPEKTAAFMDLHKCGPQFSTDLACYFFDTLYRNFCRFECGRIKHEHEYTKYVPFIKSIGKRKWTLEVEILVEWMRTMFDLTERSKKRKKTDLYSLSGFLPLSDWPLGHIIQKIASKTKATPLNQQQVALVRSILDWKQFQPSYIWFDDRVIRLRINEILGEARTVKPYKKLDGDNFGLAVKENLSLLPEVDTEIWHSVMHLATTTVGPKPTRKFNAQVKGLETNYGKERLRTVLQNLIAYALAAKVFVKHWKVGSGRHVSTGTYDVIFTDENANLLKGIVWISTRFQDQKTINQIADLCEKSMIKMLGTSPTARNGPISQALANACLFYLEQTPGIHSAARLTRLSMTVKQKGFQKRVAPIVENKAKASGITKFELEERTVPTYGLAAGEKCVPFDEYSLHIAVQSNGKLKQTWLKPNGSRQKTKPNIIGNKIQLSAKYEKIKEETKALKKVFSAQRERIDRLFAEEVQWPLAVFIKNYLKHDLVCIISQNLIWELQFNDITISVLWRDGRWEDLSGGVVEPAEHTTVRLWHPIDCDVDDILSWRARIASLGIVQPIKQAYREVYLLTEAESETVTYSNRMAAHLLKQHQMSTLMSGRGWQYSLLGGYDDGIDSQWSRKSFMTSDMIAEYLIQTNIGDDDFNDAGIYLYVGTDQLRFTRYGQPARLDTVPPRLFSEVMRDADLFVGVASVGNDPAWFDQGRTPTDRQYWESYSFGSLDGFADTRKQVLEAILPSLKIRDQVHIKGRYLIVDGKLNTYKIHLGSSNILMSPGDRYLCIVPVAAAKTKDISLPFEGDSRLSVILSKAVMLANDDKITDDQIINQILNKR